MPSGRPCLDRPLSAGVLADGSVVIREIQLTLIWLCYIHQWQTASSSLSPGLTSFGWLPFFCLHVDFLFSCAKNIYVGFFFLFQSLCGPSLRRSASSRSWHREPHDYKEIHLLAFHLTNTGSIRFMFFFFSGSKQNGLTRFYRRMNALTFWRTCVYMCVPRVITFYIMCAVHVKSQRAVSSISFALFFMTN